MAKNIMKNGNLFTLIAALILTGCMDDNPRTAIGGASGAAVGGLGGAGLAKMFGASNGAAAAIGVLGAAAGGVGGAYLGNKLDNQARLRAQQAAEQNRTVTWYDQSTKQEFAAMPYLAQNGEKRVKVVQVATGRLIADVAAGAMQPVAVQPVVAQPVAVMPATYIVR